MNLPETTDVQQTQKGQSVSFKLFLSISLSILQSVGINRFNSTNFVVDN